MIKVICYKTTQEKLPRTFCTLAEKCYHSNAPTFVYTNGKESTVELDKILWTYSRKQFIPHGTIYDLSPEKQPILISSELKNLNNSSNLIIINADESKILSILSSNENLTLTKCKRLFLLYDHATSASNENIKDIISKSSLHDLRFESYVQADDNSWQIQSDINDAKLG